MFRKDAEAVKSWGKFKTELCMKLQQEILEAAHRLIKPGGRLLYSTCTFDPREDEEMIRSFMSRHPEFNADNAEDIIRDEIGQVFAKVLECAGVYKCNETGRTALKRFLTEVQNG